MDGTGSKAVGRYLCIWIVAAAAFGAAAFGAAWMEEQTSRIKMAGILAAYPELETDLAEIYFKEELAGAERKERIRAADDLAERYGYDFYERVFRNRTWQLWIVFLLLEAGVFAVLFYQEKRKSRQDNDTVERQLYEILKQLEHFREGKFHIADDGISAVAEAADDACRNTIHTIWEEMRKLGAYFEVQRERLENEENSTKVLITDISHQLKTPIAALRISYELIAGEQLTEQERMEFLERAEQEIQRLESLLEELVNLSRLECSMIQIRPEPADIGQTLAEAVNQVYMKAHEKGMLICLEKAAETEKGTILVCHDRKWTVEAFVNVLDNAVKYSEEGSHIVIRISCLPRNILIEVEDEGMGIPAKELHRIYQRFYRGKEAERLVKEGAGVGLYLTRIILERQGGTITAKQRQERGTVFRMTLPI